MVIDIKIFFAAAILPLLVCSCCLIPTRESDSYFNSLICVTNATYDYYMPIPDSCTMTDSAKYTEVELLSMPTEMLSLAANLAYAHLRAVESMNISLRYSQVGLRSINGTHFGNRSQVLPVDFAVDDILCSEYDVKAVPFKIVNHKENLVLEEVMMAFYHKGRFCFALYILLNDCSVSLDFKRGTKSSLLLYHIATYPFLTQQEYWVQRKRLLEGR